MPVTIGLLADRPELIDALALAYEAQWPSWYGADGRGDAHADMTARARRDGVPCGVVAADGDRAVGACALAEESMSRRGEFGAWIVGLWIAPEHRRKGLALKVLEAAVGQAGALNIAEVRAGTAAAAGVFIRAGWSELAPVLHEGEEIRIFAARPVALEA